jgi:CubicO group peptidase (beta-lactamase class C family)
MPTSDWQQRLHELVERLDVPGAVLGISHRGERLIAAAGIAGLANPAPVTPDTAFQLGSISKVYTATLLLTLAGPQILDRRVAELVPEADWMDRAITVRHLLTHSSGLGGDRFTDTGRGDDALARYTAGQRDVPADHPLAPGTRYSYCNSGYAVLGRLIEILSGQTYDAALATHLSTPLGVNRTTTLPEDTILGPVALGHNRHDPEPLRADREWSFARACAPLGGISATAGDVLTFAERHLARGGELARRMQERQLENPPLSRPSARGLGWAIYDLDGGTLLGHDGETLGQIASLRLLACEQLAVVVLTNAIPDGSELASTLVAEVLAPYGLSLALIEVPAVDDGFDPTPYLGRYRNLMATHTVSAAADGAGLLLTTHHRSEGLPQERTETDRLLPLGDGAFMDPGEARPTRALRFGDPDERDRACSFSYGRIAWRVPDADE